MSDSSDARWKLQVQAATTAALPANTYNPADERLIANANGALPTVDDYAAELDDSLLVANEPGGVNNGIYLVASLGSATTPWVLARRPDCSLGGQVRGGSAVHVLNGTAHGGSIHVQTVSEPVVGLTELNWTKIAGLTIDTAFSTSVPLPTTTAAGQPGNAIGVLGHEDHSHQIGPHASVHDSGGSDAVQLAEAQVTGLVGDLAGKAPSVHAAQHDSAGGDAVQLAESQVTGLTTDLAGKAPASHTHTEANVTSLTSDLAAKQPTMWHAFVSWMQPAATTVQGTTATLLTPGSYAFGGLRYNNSNALNDGWTTAADLGPGTWQVSIQSQSQGNGAIATWDISEDGGATWIALGTQDLYAAATGQLYYWFVNVHLTVAGRHLIRVRALGRNGANTIGYVVNYSAIEFTRTA